MKKLAIMLLSTTLISGAALAKTSKTVATYAGKDVTTAQVMKNAKPLLDMQPNTKGKKFADLEPKLQELLVMGYINQQLFEAEAKKANIKKSSSYKQKIKFAEGQILQQELVEQHLKKVVTDKMIDEEYTEIAKNLKGQTEVKVSHILVETEAEAKDLKKQLNKGKNFAELAKKHSKDKGSKINGGELGYVLKGQLVPEFEAQAFAMKKGAISEPVKTNFGWHIIKKLDSRPAKIPTKAEAKEAIRAKLSREAVEQYIQDLQKQANVELKLN